MRESLMATFIVNIAGLARQSRKDLEKVTEAQTSFHTSFKATYLFPFADRATGPFILKRDRPSEDTLPTCHDIHVQSFRRRSG